MILSAIMQKRSGYTTLVVLCLINKHGKKLHVNSCSHLCFCAVYLLYIKWSDCSNGVVQLFHKDYLPSLCVQMSKTSRSTFSILSHVDSNSRPTSLASSLPINISSGQIQKCLSWQMPNSPGGMVRQHSFTSLIQLHIILSLHNLDIKH